MFHKLYTTLVVGNQKAITAFLLSFLVVGLAKLGLTPDMTLNGILETALSAVIVSVGTWLKANNK